MNRCLLKSTVRLYSSSSSTASGSKVLPTVLLLTGGSAAGLTGYYYYDPNAEIFKQAKDLLGVDTQGQSKPKLQQDTKVGSSIAPTKLEKPPPQDILKKPVPSPPLPKLQQQKISTPAPPPPPPPQNIQKATPPSSSTAAAAIPAAVASVSDKQPESKTPAASPPPITTSSDVPLVPKQILVTALRAQQEALVESHEAKLKTVKSEYERKLENAKSVIEADRVVELRGKYEKASAALTAIEQGIEARSEQNSRAKRLRSLWAQVNALHAHVNHPEYHHGDTITTTTIDKSSLQRAIEVPDKFVNQMLESLPNSPVHSLESLKSRFYNELEPIAKNVSLINEGEPFSLLKYACGKVLSWGTLHINREPASSLGKGTSTTATLDTARRSLEKGDLLSATIAVNQLTGLPRQVATDWLADARALLETNQTLFALMTYAASNNVF